MSQIHYHVSEKDLGAQIFVGPIYISHSLRKDYLMPRVLNKHHGNIPDRAVYCGRGSPVGNPFVIGRYGNRDQVCEAFEAWAPTQPKVMAYIATLKGRDLVCYCAPARCHCDWILTKANPDLARPAAKGGGLFK